MSVVKPKLSLNLSRLTFFVLSSTPASIYLDGSTEGNSNICNIDNRVGAVGFIPIGVVPEFLAERLLPLKLIKVNSETGEPLRDNDGYCIRCQPGEEGEFIGKIVKGDPVKDFTGYRDPAATKKKILQNVFREGRYIGIGTYYYYKLSRDAYQLLMDLDLD